MTLHVGGEKCEFIWSDSTALKRKPFETKKLCIIEIHISAILNQKKQHLPDIATLIEKSTAITANEYSSIEPEMKVTENEPYPTSINKQSYRLDD